MILQADAPTMDEVSFIFGLAIGFTLSSTGAVPTKTRWGNQMWTVDDFFFSGQQCFGVLFEMNRKFCVIFRIDNKTL